jgi:hypothetical protein
MAHGHYDGSDAQQADFAAWARRLIASAATLGGVAIVLAQRAAQKPA